MTALLKSKGSLAQLAPVVAWDPAPVYVSGYTKLREGFAAAQAWQVPLGFMACAGLHHSFQAERRD